MWDKESLPIKSKFLYMQWYNLTSMAFDRVNPDWIDSSVTIPPEGHVGPEEGQIYGYDCFVKDVYSMIQWDYPNPSIQSGFLGLKYQTSVEQPFEYLIVPKLAANSVQYNCPVNGKPTIKRKKRFYCGDRIRIALNSKSDTDKEDEPGEDYHRSKRDYCDEVPGVLETPTTASTNHISPESVWLDYRLLSEAIINSQSIQILKLPKETIDALQDDLTVLPAPSITKKFKGVKVKSHNGMRLVNEAIKEKMRQKRANKGSPEYSNKTGSVTISCGHLYRNPDLHLSDFFDLSIFSLSEEHDSIHSQITGQEYTDIVTGRDRGQALSESAQNVQQLVNEQEKDQDLEASYDPYNRFIFSIHHDTVVRSSDPSDISRAMDSNTSYLQFFVGQGLTCGFHLRVYSAIDGGVIQCDMEDWLLDMEIVHGLKIDKEKAESMIYEGATLARIEEKLLYEN